MLAFCFALLIAVSAVQCSVVSASATGLPEDSWAGGSITATLDIKEQDAENVTVNAYKLVSVHTAQLDGTNPAVVSFAAAFRRNLSAFCEPSPF